MGNCWGTKISSDSPSLSASTSGASSRYARRKGTGLSTSSSRVSSASVPPTPRSEGEILQSANVRSFTFNELKTATRNFQPDSVLGEGGFGSVFKGWIDENTFGPSRPGTGMVIAVKKLNQEGIQGHREWLAEVNYLGQLSQPNLVKLVGYCLEDEQRLLVYEFMPRGSLENHLFRRGSHFQPLSWNLRMKVALGAAKGLAFLHSDKAKVIYRDFKTSNVLLDSNYNAKLSDFGLAKDGPTGDKSHVSTRVMGTYGYAAPEYLATGHLTAKSDVYSFGVVLLEMLSGRACLGQEPPLWRARPGGVGAAVPVKQAAHLPHPGRPAGRAVLPRRGPESCGIGAPVPIWEFQEQAKHGAGGCSSGATSGCKGDRELSAT